MKLVKKELEIGRKTKCLENKKIYMNILINIVKKKLMTLFQDFQIVKKNYYILDMDMIWKLLLKMMILIKINHLDFMGGLCPK